MTKLADAPATLLVKSEGGDDSFLMQRHELITLQRYILSALSLPQSLETLQTRVAALDLNNKTMTDRVSPLLNGYKQIHGHATDWNTNTFPKTVELSSNVYQYSEKAKKYFRALLDPIQDLIEDNDNEKARKTLLGLLATLQASAENYAKTAAEVVEEILVFQNHSKEDETLLTTLKNDFDKEYGSKSEFAARIQAELTAARKKLDELNDDYDFNVVVAATTPTYAWVPLYGWIPAVIVAGVYGDRAVKTLNDIHEKEKEIKTLEAEHQTYTNLALLNGQSVTDINKIRTLLEQALPVIQKIHSVWTSIATDLSQVATIVENDIAKAIPVLKSLGIGEAVDLWETVGARANAYRVNAFIVQEPTEVVQKELEAAGIPTSV